MTVHLPSTSALRAFEAAARRLSFTAAAGDLNLTQGAISHQIRDLETRLGTALFVRRGRGLALTEAGQRYLPFVREGLERLRAGGEAVRPAGRAMVLTVSVSPNFATKWLVPRLGAFLAAHPDIDLRISAAMAHVDFAGDGIDLAVRHGTGDWPGSTSPACAPRRSFRSAARPCWPAGRPCVRRPTWPATC